MNLFKKLFVAGILLASSFSVFAYSCILGGYGHCIWAGIDKNERRHINLIDTKAFLSFCDKYKMRCYSYNNGYHSVMGRYLDEDSFILATNEWGGPDLIMDNKSQAEKFAQEFKRISPHPEAFFYVKNVSDPDPIRNIVTIGYREKNSAGQEKIQLMILPDQWDDCPDDHTYRPPDM